MHAMACMPIAMCTRTFVVKIRYIYYMTAGHLIWPVTETFSSTLGCT